MKIYINASSDNYNVADIAEVANILEKSEYNYYGFRNATNRDLKAVNSGRGYLDPSYEWVDNEITDTLLGGTSAIFISSDMSEDELYRRYMQCLNGYKGDTVLLIADSDSEWGEDDNEIILGHSGYGADFICFVEAE